MAVVQEMCARIGMVTGRGLAANIRTHYPAPLLYITTILLFAANTFNLGVDLGAMANATQLIVPSVSFLFLVLFFAAISLYLQIFTTYARYAQYLKYLTLALLSYIGVAFIVHIDWHDALTHTLIPSITYSRDQILLICAILGTTISPYLFFWQPSQEIEESLLKERERHSTHHTGASKSAISRMRTDVWSGMAYSNAIMFFIIAACAATLYAHGITTIATADQAAAALRPIAGDAAYFLFALGIIGTGMLAVPILAGSASYALSETFGWHMGLYRKLKDARAFYGVIIVAMIVGILVNLSSIDPMKALIYAAVVNGLIAPILLVFIVQLSSNKKLMGTHASGTLSQTVGWITIVAMTISGVAVIFSLF
jgi:Mn2+/Fe2+ NRAMP family transporter